MGMRPLSEKHPITQRFRQNLTQYNVGGSHGAVDIGAPVGSKVVAPEDLTIVYDGWSWGLPGGPEEWGARWFQIKPAVGDTKTGGGIMTVARNGAGSTWIICHANRSFFNAGDKVRKGQVIQDSGNTGSSTGPHSHIALLPPNPNYSNGYWGGIDPEPYIQERYAPVGESEERKTTGEGYLHGIDVSDFQPADIATRVSAQFVIVKTSEGIGWTAKNWRRQLDDARKAGRKVGVYHYARPQNNAKAEAEFFYNTVKAADGPDLVWFLDWEETAYYGNPGWASEFMARLDQLTGKTTGLYANTQGLTTGAWPAKDKARPVWRAFPVLSGTGYAASFNLPAAPAGWARLVLDQYSFHGRLPGYPGDLDLNVYYGGIPAWGAVGSASTDKEWFRMSELSPGVAKEIGDIVDKKVQARLDRHWEYMRDRMGGVGGKTSYARELLFLTSNQEKFHKKLDAIVDALGVLLDREALNLSPDEAYAAIGRATVAALRGDNKEGE